ncbi:MULTISPECIES: acylphosphatase [Motilimonas]|uniref:acylphosphatase n=1 Tax=Motilimonas cestriensis TaxID=2742685 RepID=A0ABS8WCD3_9GAMM|nr:MULTISPECIES: acylphosphatase [Motilimonas]MCE0556949.1 acylphosphatase [Motilimonas sp. E26]MCE2595271.1 acylphosphatase [Motilimonas cestriensis]MDO6525500.1 acylphosphatase [Motilimonas sp. 1_MG-2023]
MSKIGVHVVVSGTVQEVGFRFFTVREAERLGIVGHVRNLESGEVDIEAFGEPEAIKNFLAFLEHGPKTAMVEHLVAKEIPVKHLISFTSS